jgi:hypothetical protein
MVFVFVLWRVLQVGFDVGLDERTNLGGEVDLKLARELRLTQKPLPHSPLCFQPAIYICLPVWVLVGLLNPQSGFRVFIEYSARLENSITVDS